MGSCAGRANPSLSSYNVTASDGSRRLLGGRRSRKLDSVGPDAIMNLVETSSQVCSSTEDPLLKHVAAKFCFQTCSYIIASNPDGVFNPWVCCAGQQGLLLHVQPHGQGILQGSDQPMGGATAGLAGEGGRQINDGRPKEMRVVTILETFVHKTLIYR